MRYLQKFTRGFKTNLHAEISFIWVFSNSFLSYSHLKYGNAWNADKKNCVHNLPVNKKNALRISRQTYNNQNSIKRAGGWYLFFTHGIEITAWTGNVSGIFYSNLPSWKWGDGFTFSSQHLWPLFFAYLFLLSLAHWSHKLCNDHKWSIKRPWKRKIVSGPRKLTLKLRA